MQKKKDILFNDHWIYYHLLISGPTQNLRSYVGTNPKFLIVRAKPEFQEASQIHKFCKRPKHVVHLGFVETKTGQKTGLCWGPPYVALRLLLTSDKKRS